MRGLNSQAQSAIGSADRAASGQRFSEFASVGRAVAILEALAGERYGVSVTDLSAALDLSKTTVFRILSSLKVRGYVEQDPITSRYALTFRVVTLSYRYLAVHELNELCMPVLRRVAEETGELVRLAAVEGDQLRWIAQAEGSVNRIRLTADLGQPVSLHASATGKAWLSTLPDSEALRVALTRGLAKRTPNTITTVEALLAEFSRTRERGYALAIEEGDAGVSAVAVPIRHPEADAAAPAVGTISVAGTVLNLDQARLASFAPLLKQAAIDVAQFWFGFYAAPDVLIGRSANPSKRAKRTKAPRAASGATD